MMEAANIVNFVKDNAKTIGAVAISAATFTAAAVCAEKVVTKLDIIKEEHKKRMQEIEEVLADESIPAETYTEEDAANDAHILKTQAVVNGAKAFLPSMIVIGSGIVAGKALNSIYIPVAAAAGSAVGVAFNLANNKLAKETE